MVDNCAICRNHIMDLCKSALYTFSFVSCVMILFCTAYSFNNCVFEILKHFILNLAILNFAYLWNIDSFFNNANFSSVFFF